MLPDTGIDDVKKQRNAEYAKHIKDPVLSSLKIEGIRLRFFFNIISLNTNTFIPERCKKSEQSHGPAGACALLPRLENRLGLPEEQGKRKIWKYEGGRDSRMETVSQ
jgi:hypothetical protein